MNALALLATAFGWMVVHSVWQIGLVWLAFQLISPIFQSNSVKYWLAVSSMGAAVMLALATFCRELPTCFSEKIAAPAIVFEIEKSAENRQSDLGFQKNQPNNPIEKSAPIRFENRAIPFFESVKNSLANRANLIGLIWLTVVSLLFLRFAGGWFLARRLQKTGLDDLPVDLTALFETLKKRLNFNQKVALRGSLCVAEPVTLGWLKPVILFPAALVCQLTPGQLEALLLHELAHIRRRDFAINFVQTMLENVFFFHPLFWWLSRETRRLRELCCDEEVIAQPGIDRQIYARTLTDLKLNLLTFQTSFAMTATGNSPRFTQRIRYILGLAEPEKSARSPLVFFSLLAVGLAGWSMKMAPKMDFSSNEKSVAAVFQKLESIENEPILIEKKAVLFKNDSLPPAKSRSKFASEPAEKTPDIHPETLDVSDGQPQPDRSGVAISVEKMNVFYVGVENPIRIAANEFAASEIEVKLVGNGSLKGSGPDFIVLATAPGELFIQVFGTKNGRRELLARRPFRVKRIPDPTPLLGGQLHSQGISKAEFMRFSGVEAILQNFDFEAVCEIVSYSLAVVIRGIDPVEYVCNGPAFSPGILARLETAPPTGTIIYIDEIIARCPGDTEPRKIGGLVFKWRE